MREQPVLLAIQMGGKSKKANTPRAQKNMPQHKTSKQQSTATCTGPGRVLFLRHGQSEANASGRDVPDPHLTGLGAMQAKSWKGIIGAFGSDVVIVSPLRRAIQTALLAFDGVDIPVEVVRHARELWWNEQANTPSTAEAVNEL